MNPWEMTFRGRTWQDMPGTDEDMRKMNFYLWRIGRLDLVDATHEAGREEVEGMRLRTTEEPVRGRLRMVSLDQRRFGKMGRRMEKRTEEMEERIAERVARERERAAINERRAVLKRRLMKFVGVYGAQRQIAARAGMDDTTVHRFVSQDDGLTSLARLEKMEAVLDELEAGKWSVVARAGSHHNRPRKCPAGHEPYKAWLAREAARRTIKPHSLRVHLDRHPEEQPTIVKLGSRSWFVPMGQNQTMKEGGQAA